MRKKYLLYVFSFIFSIYQAQNTNLPNVAPLSPNSASFEKYGIVPVNLSSGVITPNIPLYTLHAGKDNFNLSLNYSSQGIRADELPTPIGMGWSLNLGSITRNSRDLPDESFQHMSPITQISGSDNYLIGEQVSKDDGVDSVSDIFTVNVDGIYTKFIIENKDQINVTIRKLVSDDIKIEFLILPELLSQDKTNVPKLKITSPNGTIYYFGGNDGVESTFSRANGAGSIPPAAGDVVNTWLLSKVVYPSGQEINIFYEKAIIAYKDNISQNTTIKYMISDSKVSDLPQINPPNTTNTYIRSTITRPSYITNGKNKISFKLSSFQNVVPSYDYPKIEGLDVFAINDNIAIPPQLISDIDFLYTSYPSINIASNDLSQAIERPFLSQINFNDSKKTFISNYKFEYYSPDKMPERMSFSQDILGYYNGVNNHNFIFNSLKDYSDLPGYKLIKEDEAEFNAFLFNASGKRRPNINYSKFGSLKSMTYPTKGYSIFDYEGNLTNVEEKIYPPFQNITLNIIPNIEDPMLVTKTIDDFSVPFDQELFIVGNSIQLKNIDPGSNICNPDPNHDNATLSILDKSTNETLEFNSISNLGNFTVAPSYSFNTSNYYFDDNSQERLYLDLKQGRNYTITLKARKCYEANVDFAYYNSLPTTQNVEVEVGGLRIKSLSNYDSNNLLTTQKLYLYGEGQYSVGKPKSDLDKKDILIELIHESALDVLTVGILENKSYSLSSNSELPLRNLWGEFYTYPIVTEKITDDNTGKNNGLIEHNFNVKQSNLPISIQNTETATTILGNFGSATNEILTIYKDSQNNTIKKIENIYADIPNIGVKIEDYTAKATLEVHTARVENPNQYTDNEFAPTTSDTSDSRWWSIMKAWYYPVLNRINSTVTTDYLNGKGLKTETEYFYNNPAHYQVTSQKTTFPDGAVSQFDYQYAQEKVNQKLIDANMVGIPLETEITKNGKMLSRTETKYDNPLNLLPSSVLSYDLQNSLPTTEVTYNQYDSLGNLQQYTTKAGIPVAIIWGYNSTQPIAKIEGATYAQVSSLATALIAASDLDAADPTKEQDLITALDTFRKDSTMVNYQISTYTYDPLIGVTSITPPSGIREIYKYDSANRLQSVVDVNGNILKENKYNYKP